MNTEMSSSESIRRCRGEILGQSSGVREIQRILGLILRAEISSVFWESSARYR